MKTIDMDLLHYSVDQALSTLVNGNIILYPTDTVWGIGCDATNEKAIEKIYRLKKRDDTKSMIILVADEHEVLKYAQHLSPDILGYLKSFDRPTTVIYEKAIGLPDNLVNSNGSVAIRVVTETFCRMLIERLGKPIVSTSANISGQATPKKFSEISKEIIQGVDYVVDYRQDDDAKTAPSRIIKLNQDGSVKVIRG